MWCIPGQLDREYIERMEDILNLLEKPADSREPVVCLDERPVQLHAEIRAPKPAKPGRIARRDSEYKRCGTANVFAVTAPAEGVHLTKATRNRKGVEFARTMLRIARRFPKARRIHLIMDNLNTHRLKSLTDAFGERDGLRLWKRFVPHYTPKHASWLNPAEIEISLLSRECFGRDRFSEFDLLRRRVSEWNANANRRRRTIKWKFTARDARKKFRYSRRGVRIRLARH
jgi:transposase